LKPKKGLEGVFMEVGRKELGKKKRVLERSVTVSLYDIELPKLMIFINGDMAMIRL